MRIVVQCCTSVHEYMGFLWWQHCFAGRTWQYNVSKSILSYCTQCTSWFHGRLIVFAAAQAVDTWLKSLDIAEQRSFLKIMFDKYVSSTMSYCSKHFRTITPIVAINEALTICKLLEGLLIQAQLTYGMFTLTLCATFHRTTCKQEFGLSSTSLLLHLWVYLDLSSCGACIWL